MLLAFGLAGTVFTSCDDKDNDPLPPDAENPADPNTPDDPDNPDNPTVTNQYDWIQTTQQITYAADGVSEASRQEITYDADGRETGMKYYANGVLTHQYRDYQYNGRTVTFWNDVYSNGNVQTSIKNQRTYSEKNWIQITQYITYAADGVTEAVHQEITYDADGRETGMKSYANGVLMFQYRDYQHNGRTITFWNDVYSNGNVQTSIKNQRTYSEKNWIQATQNITYTAEGMTEASRQEITYDADGRETGMKYYANGVLIHQYRDYQYNGRTVTLWFDFYLEGSLQSTTKIQRTYR